MELLLFLLVPQKNGVDMSNERIHDVNRYVVGKKIPKRKPKASINNVSRI